MSPFLKRAYVAAGAVLGSSVIMYLIYKSDSGPITKIIVIFGGIVFLFIMIKSYLLRM